MLTLLPNNNLDHNVVIQYHSVLTELLRSFQNNQQLNHVTLNYNDDILGYDHLLGNIFCAELNFT